MRSLCSVLVAALLLLAGAAAEAAKSSGPLKLGAQTGLGYDSNFFNRPAAETDAFSNESTLKGRYRISPAKRLRWTSGAGLTSSYRYADSASEAFKLRVDGRTGLDWKMFGGNKKGEPFRASGRLGAGIAYSGTFNPTLDNPFENELDIDIDDEIEDLLEDEFALDEIDDFADSADWDEEWDQDEDGIDDSFFDEDPLSGRFFNSKASRHLLTPALRASFRPCENTSLGMLGRFTLGEIEQIDPTKPSSDYKQAGAALRLRHRLVPKRVDLNGGFDFANRWYDEKKTAAGADLESWNLSVVAGATLRPIRRLKSIVSYRYGVRLVPPDEPKESFQHTGRVGLQYRLAKDLWLWQENSFLFNGLQDNDTRDAFRYQGMLGLRWTM